MSVNYNMDIFFQDLDAVINNNRPRILFEELFSINFVKYDPSRIASLQLSLQQFDNNTLSSIVEKNNTINKVSWPSFENFVYRYLLCIRDLDPWSVLNSIDLMISVFECQSFLFNPKIPVHQRICKQLIPLFEESMSLMIQLASFIDIESMHINNRSDNYPRLTHISTILMKALNNMRSTPDLNDSRNIDMIGLLIDTSTNLCNVYYKIGSPPLCNNVFSNVNILSLNKNLISKSRLVKLRFIMGKFYAHQGYFRQAYHHLNACFTLLRLETCPVSNIFRILKYLIPVGLLVGKVADINKVNFMLMNNRIQNEEDRIKLKILVDIYSPLIINYKTGNFHGAYKSISNNENYWKNIGLWIPMLQSLRVPIFRNLLYQIWKSSGETLSFETIRIGLHESLRGMPQLKPVYQFRNNPHDPIDDEFIENVIAGVINCGYSKMKITAEAQIILSKKDTFPEMFEVVCGRYYTSPREAWLDK